jgi:hypothetical protein
MGKRFMDVTNRPIHPANAMGWRSILTLSGKSPTMTRERKENRRESPRTSDPFTFAKGTISDMLSPTIHAISETIKPAMGPEAPMSISALRVIIGDFILIKAPNVPIKDGAGIK